MSLRSSFSFVYQGVSLRFILRNFPYTSKLLLDDARSRTMAITWSLRLK
jgi:hypothetical protein